MDTWYPHGGTANASPITTKSFLFIQLQDSDTRRAASVPAEVQNLIVEDGRTRPLNPGGDHDERHRRRPRHHPPTARPRRRPPQLAVAGRLTWRDANGTLRFASVVTRDISETDAFVECQMPASIPLFRLVHFQVERSAQGRARPPRRRCGAGKLLSAVYRVGPCESATGTPKGYAIRLLTRRPASRRTPARDGDADRASELGSRLADLDLLSASLSSASSGPGRATTTRTPAADLVRLAPASSSMCRRSSRRSAFRTAPSARRRSPAGQRLAHQRRHHAPGCRPAPAGARAAVVTGPQCVRNSVSGCQRFDRSMLSRHSSHVDVGRRRRRQHVAAVDADAGRVAHPRDAARRDRSS